jgi:hypothetical protein
MKTKVEGFKELEVALGELKQSAARGVARKVLRKAGDPFMAAWRTAMPEGEGKLREDLKMGGRLTRVQARAARKGRKKSEVLVYIGVADPAGQQTEFGNAHQAAQPHGRPTWEAYKIRVLEAISNMLGQEIYRAISRARKRAERAAAKK